MGSNNTRGRRVTTTPVSLSDFREHLSGAVAEYVRSIEAGESALVVCARVTWEAFAAGLVGADAPEEGFKSQRDYAKRFLHPRTSQPVALATVQMWKRYGRAMALGVDETTLTRIGSVWGDSRISETLDTGSKTAIVKAVKGLYGPDGKRIPRPKPQAAAPAAESKGQAVPETRNDSTTLDAIETLAARLSTVMSPAAEKRLAALVESLGERLATSKAGHKARKAA